MVSTNDGQFVFGQRDETDGIQPLCAAARATTSNTLKVNDGGMFDKYELIL